MDDVQETAGNHGRDQCAAMESARSACAFRVSVSLGISLAFATGCDFHRTSDQGFEVVDSAGVRFVTSSAPAWETRQGWSLSAEPTVRIGLVDGPPAYLFDRVVGAVTLAGGAIAVADMGSAEVRIFASDGEFRVALGRSGQGPGEFRQLISLSKLPGDTLAAVDRLQRVHFFSPDGIHVRTVEIGTLSFSIDAVTFHEGGIGQFSTRLTGFMHDGSFVIRTSDNVTLDESGRFDVAQTPDVVFTLRGRDGQAIAELVRAPGRTYVPHPANLVLPQVFGDAVYARTVDTRLVLGFSGTGEIHWVSHDGDLLQVGSRDWPVRPVSEAMFEAHVSGSVPPLNEDVARGRTPADVLPAFSTLVVDRDANVWVRHFEVEHEDVALHYVRTSELGSTWSVFGPDGRWRGEVGMPARFTPLEIGRAHVLGLSRDELDVEQVQRFELLKPEGA